MSSLSFWQCTRTEEDVKRWLSACQEASPSKIPTNTGRNAFLLFEPPSLGHCVMAAQGDGYAPISWILPYSASNAITLKSSIGVIYWPACTIHDIDNCLQEGFEVSSSVKAASAPRSHPWGSPELIPEFACIWFSLCTVLENCFYLYQQCVLPSACRSSGIKKQTTALKK